MSAHICHAISCGTPCAPRLLMCPDHWARLPQHHKDAIRREYVRGQERNYRLVTGRYLVTQAKAVLTMGTLDGVDPMLLKRQCNRLKTLTAKYGDTDSAGLGITD